MENHFNKQVIWITGASSGIGEALAYAFSKRGAKLILSSRRTEELERVKAACDSPEQVFILPLDLSGYSLAGKQVHRSDRLFRADRYHDAQWRRHPAGSHHRYKFRCASQGDGPGLFQLCSNYQGPASAFQIAEERTFCGHKQRDGKNRHADAIILRSRQTRITRFFRLPAGGGLGRPNSGNHSYPGLYPHEHQPERAYQRWRQAGHPFRKYQ